MEASEVDTVNGLLTSNYSSLHSYPDFCLYHPHTAHLPCGEVNSITSSNRSVHIQAYINPNSIHETQV